MDWTDLEICTFHLPNLTRLKPVVWCQVRVKAVVGLGLLNQLVLEEGGVLGQVLIREPCPDLANALVLLVLGLIASKKDPSILASALALAQVASQDDEVKGVSNPLQVVLLQLQPIMRSAGDLIGCVYVQCLHHQTPEVISEHLPTLFKRLCDQTLPVEKEKVKGKDANLDLDLLLHGILPLPGGEHLERLDALLLPIPGHSLTIQHRRLEALSQAGLEASNDVGELGSVVLLVAAEDVHLPILVQGDLGSLPIVLPLTGEPAVLKPGEHLLDSLGGMCQHRFQWDPRSESTTRSQTIDTCLEKGRQENVVAGTLTVGGLQLQTLLGKLLFELLSLSVLVHRVLGGRVLLARGGLNTSLGQRLKHRLLCQTNPQLASKHADQIPGLTTPASHQQRLDLLHLLGAGAVPGQGGNVLQLLKDRLNCQLLGLKHGALTSSALLCHKPKITKLSHIGLDLRCAAPCRVGDRLDQETLPDPQLDALPGRSKPVQGHVDAGLEVCRCLNHDRAEIIREDFDGFQPAASRLDRLQGFGKSQEGNCLTPRQKAVIDRVIRA